MTTDFSKRRNFIRLVSRLKGAHAHKRSSLGSRDFRYICNKLVEETYASFNGLHNEPLRFGRHIHSLACGRRLYVSKRQCHH
jgi:hypothetical protein